MPNINLPTPNVTKEGWGVLINAAITAINNQTDNNTAAIAAGGAGGTGPAGPQGIRGGRWYHSEAANPDPANVADPVEGDMFLYPQSRDFFRYESGAWSYGGNLGAIKGDTGPQGPAGPAGGGSVDTSSSNISIFRGAMAKRLTTSPVTIVWLGSSSTAGNNASTAENRYVNKVMTAIRQAYPLPSGSHPTGVQTLSQAASSAPSGAGIFGVNAGISGSRSGNQNGATPYINSTTRSQIAALNPRVLVHMIGANDYGNGVPVATYKANVKAEIDALDAAISVAHVHILIHTYPRFDSAALSARVAPWSDYLTALKEIQAATANVAVIDNSDDWARQGVTGVANGDPWNYIDTDDIHMNDSGHDFMATLVANELIGAALPSTSTGGGTVTPPAGTAPTITTSSLNAMTVGQAFSQTVQYTGDAATFTASGLPGGLAISSAGVISGTPTTAGTGNVTLTATNSTGSDSKTLAYTVAAASGGGGTPTPLTILYSDSFDRANTTTVGTSATDMAYGGSAINWQQNAAAWQITSNQLAGTGTAGGQFLAVGQANYEIRALIGALPAGSGTTLWTLDGRRNQLTSSGATQYRLYLRSDGSGRVTNGSADILTFAAGTFAAGQWIGLRMSGTTISVVKATAATDAGTVVTSGTNSDVSNASGFAGFSRVATETTGRWDGMAIVAA